MLAIFLFISVCYGVTNIITSGKIFEGLRLRCAALPGRLGKAAGYWIKCPMCMGFCTGIWWYLVGLNPGIHDYTLGWLAAGAISSAWCWIIRVFLAKLGEDQL